MHFFSNCNRLHLWCKCPILALITDYNTCCLHIQIFLLCQYRNMYGYIPTTATQNMKLSMFKIVSVDTESIMCQWCHAQKVSLDRHLMADTLKSNT